MKLGVSPTGRELYNLFESVVDSEPIIEDHPGFERVLEEIERRVDAGGFTEEDEAAERTAREKREADDELDDDLSAEDEDDSDEEDEDDEVEAAPPARPARRTASRSRAVVVEPEDEEEDDFGGEEEEDLSGDESWPEPDVRECRKLLKGVKVVLSVGEQRV